MWISQGHTEKCNLAAVSHLAGILIVCSLVEAHLSLQMNTTRLFGTPLNKKEFPLAPSVTARKRDWL